MFMDRQLLSRVIGELTQKDGGGKKTANLA